jgi:hypothetical protein
MKAFVTGASEGLGRAFAIRLAKEGYRVTAVARNEGRLAELLEELDGGPHEILPADLSERKGVDRCAEKLRDGSFRLLVNNAGCSRFGSYAEAEIDDELRILAVNCEAAMILAHAFLEVAESGDALINLSSLTYVLPTPIQPTYVRHEDLPGLLFGVALVSSPQARGLRAGALSRPYPNAVPPTRWPEAVHRSPRVPVHDPRAGRRLFSARDATTPRTDRDSRIRQRPDRHPLPTTPAPVTGGTDRTRRRIRPRGFVDRGPRSPSMHLEHWGRKNQIVAPSTRQGATYGGTERQLRRRAGDRCLPL